MREKILGVEVDAVDKEQAIARITDWIDGGKRRKMVVTLYSEFLVKAQEDRDFRQVINDADLITADGVSVLAALQYKKKPGFINGLRVGGRILSQRVGETVTGVWLFERLIKEAAEKGYKVFLLGGYGKTAEELASRLREENYGLKIESDMGEQTVGMEEETNEVVLKRIDKFEPDLLFVAYGPVVQEKWIAANLNRMNVGVAVGVGGTFDEVLGRIKRAPVVMEKMGLKWLWRLMLQPKRLGRIWRGVVVFPWLVWRKEK